MGGSGSGRGRGEKAASKEEIERLDVYTADKIYYLQKEGQGDWAPVKIQKTGDEKVSGSGIVNIFKKIPVVYYSQPATEGGLIRFYLTYYSSHLL